jgi:transcriptional regulator with XRE-family HTH domain
VNPLTPGERFLIWRRRKGLTQAKAARLHGVRLKRVQQWESGIGNYPPPLVELLPTRLSDGERCMILRRRAGLTAAMVGRELGVSRHIIEQYEHGEGNVSLLLAYWRRRAA